MNRIVSVQENGVSIEADPRHAEELVRIMELDGCNAVGTPGVKCTAEKCVTDNQLH